MNRNGKKQRYDYDRKKYYALYEFTNGVIQKTKVEKVAEELVYDTDREREYQSAHHFTSCRLVGYCAKRLYSAQQIKQNPKQ